MRIKSAYKENLGDVDMSKCQSKGPYFKGSDGTEKFRIRFYIESIKIEWEYPSKEARDKELAAIDKICKVIDLGEKKPEEISKPDMSVGPWVCTDCGFSVPTGYKYCPFCVCLNKKCGWYDSNVHRNCAGNYENKTGSYIDNGCPDAIRGNLEPKYNL